MLFDTVWNTVFLAAGWLNLSTALSSVSSTSSIASEFSATVLMEKLIINV
jgi:hypothetical protein